MPTTSSVAGKLLSPEQMSHRPSIAAAYVSSVVSGSGDPVGEPHVPWQVESLGWPGTVPARASCEPPSAPPTSSARPEHPAARRADAKRALRTCMVSVAFLGRWSLIHPIGMALPSLSSVLRFAQRALEGREQHAVGEARAEAQGAGSRFDPAPCHDERADRHRFALLDEHAARERALVTRDGRE